MKLTDEKILVLASTWGIGAEGRVMWEPFVISFARAILKEAGIEELERQEVRYRWILHQAWFQEAFDRFAPEDDGLQCKFEKCVAEIADAAMEQTKNK